MTHEGHQPTELAMPTPAELFDWDPRGATGLNSIGSQILRNRRTEGSLTPAELAKSLGQDASAFSNEVNLFAPAKPRVRDNVVFEQARTIIIDEATLVVDTTPTPHESTRPRRKTGRVGAASGAMFAAALVVGGSAVLAQESSPAPSAAPSFEPLPSVTPDPITGLLPCPSPTPAPSESIIPDRTLPPDIGKIPGGGVLFAQRQNSNGETVSLVAQQAASPAPSIGELFPSLSPAPTDPLTGAIICPSPTPITEAPTPTPKPKYDVSLSGVDLLNSIIADNQDKKDIEKTSISDIENKIDDMWGKYKDAFSNVRGIDDATVDKQYFKWWLKAMETGHHPNDTKKVIKSYTKQNIIDNRIRYSASSVIETLIVYQNTSDPDARFAIAELLDLERNYAVRGVNPAEWEKANTSFTNTVNNLVILNKAQLPSSN